MFLTCSGGGPDNFLQETNFGGSIFFLCGMLSRIALTGSGGWEPALDWPGSRITGTGLGAPSEQPAQVAGPAPYS